MPSLISGTSGDSLRHRWFSDCPRSSRGTRHTRGKSSLDLFLTAFSVRGLLPWPDFWNCISVYNQEDFRAYFANMVRMRMNMFGMHVLYPKMILWPNLICHSTSPVLGIVQCWKILQSRVGDIFRKEPQHFKMGAAQFYDRETFGADATRLAADNWEIADRNPRTPSGRSNVCIAARNPPPESAFRTVHEPRGDCEALPPESKSHPKGLVESVVGRDLLERRLCRSLGTLSKRRLRLALGRMKQRTGTVAKKNLPLSTTPFIQAHDFLRRHAPEKHLVLAGWGGIVRNFESLHQRLPGDITFAALSNTLGWDPINESFRKLEDRQRWVIPCSRMILRCGSTVPSEPH